MTSDEALADNEPIGLAEAKAEKEPDMFKTYRADWRDDDRLVQVVSFGDDRQGAMRYAARMSKRHGNAYAIASEAGRDTGQRVYCDGRFCYQDYEF